MRLLPIPCTDEYLEKTQSHWMPLLEKVSRGCTGESMDELLRLVWGHFVQIILAWDEEKNQARALVGVRYVMRGKDKIAEIIWSSDRHRDEFGSLLPELEQFLRDHMGCAVSRPIPRMAWTKMLARHGYRMTHAIMEKDLWAEAPVVHNPSK